MIFLKQTYFNTTTISSITSGTGTVGNLIDKRPSTQYETVGFSGDLTTASIVLNFAVTQTISNIIILNHNLEDMVITYDTATALDTISGNSDTSLYLTFATITTDRLTFFLAGTIVSDEEKKVGEIIISELLYDFATDRLPTANNYNPEINKKQVVQRMSDGGVNIYSIAEKFRTSLKFDFVPTSTEISFKSVYDSSNPINFVPFETSSSWDAAIYEVVWTGKYDFLKFSDNLRGNGFTGSIILEETPGRI